MFYIFSILYILYIYNFLYLYTLYILYIVHNEFPGFLLAITRRCLIPLGFASVYLCSNSLGALMQHAHPLRCGRIAQVSKSCWRDKHLQNIMKMKQQAPQICHFFEFLENWKFSKMYFDEFEFFHKIVAFSVSAVALG